MSARAFGIRLALGKVFLRRDGFQASRDQLATAAWSGTSKRQTCKPASSTSNALSASPDILLVLVLKCFFNCCHQKPLYLTLQPCSGLGLANASRLAVAPWTCRKTNNNTTLVFSGPASFDFRISPGTSQRTEGSSCAIARLSFILALSNPISISIIINSTHWRSCLSGGEDLRRRSLILETMSLIRRIRATVAPTT